MTSEHVDVLVVGAGLSGIAAAYYLQTHSPSKSYLILEARDAIGGTWDLFRYPGVRSDSDMYTLGYTFRPWDSPNAIAEGGAIRQYIRDTAAAFGIDQKIRFKHRMCGASWSSQDARWTVDVERGDGGAPLQITCKFLFMCTGYYDYSKGYTPEWTGVEQFKGTIIHPQQWREDLDYTGKRVIVIGSGATAVTLVPAMAQKAAHVTMLQRSPSYVVTMPTADPLTKWLYQRLPLKPAYKVARWRAILRSMALYYIARWRPAATKKTIVDMARQELGAGFNVEKHFAPDYNPWDQRVCLVPDADLFAAIKSGKVSVVTDHITTFTENGVQLRSGEHLDADVIVTATGLVMRLSNGGQLTVDGAAVNLAERLVYKGMMLSGVPNMAFAFGYTNASWTLKAELTCAYVSRLLNFMDRHGYTQAVPRVRDASVGKEPAVNFTSGYVQRALRELPSQGSKRPWRLYQNYILDLLTLRFGALEDGTLTFGRG